MLKKIIFIICVLAIACSGLTKNFVLADELIVLASSTCGNDKSSSISAQINGHTLSVAFTENLGTVSIEIKDEGGATLDITGMGTPSGYVFYIPLAGRYTVFFKLSNGDEYYGDFEVTD